MARQAKPAITPVAPEIKSAPAEGRREQALVAKQAEHLAEVQEQYGIDVPFDVERYIAHAQGLIQSIGSQSYELGRVLVSIREAVVEGQLASIYERIGVTPRFAQKCMQAAVKFSGSEGKELLASRLSAAKLLELVSEDDVELEKLAKGGTLLGATVDEIARMSVRELRTALRKERAEREAQEASFEEQLQRKDKKINALDRKSKALAKSPTREQADAVLSEIDQTVGEIISLHTVLTDGIHALHQVYKDAGEKMDADMRLRIEASADLIGKQLGSIQRAFAGK